VFKASEAGDAIAQSIVSGAVSALVESVQTVASRLSLGKTADGQPYPIVLSGAHLQPLVLECSFAE
jgi:hypothetical protein